MNSDEEKSRAPMSDDDMLTTATNNSLKRLDAEVEALVGLAMQRTDDSVYRALASAGLVGTEQDKNAASAPLQQHGSQFFR